MVKMAGFDFLKSAKIDFTLNQNGTWKLLNYHIVQIEIFINWFHVIFLAVWVDDDWSYSFIVPGTIIALGGLVIWLFLVPKPEDVNLSSDITVSSKKYVFIFSSNRLISKPFQDLAFETCFLFTFWKCKQSQLFVYNLGPKKLFYVLLFAY